MDKIRERIRGLKIADYFRKSSRDDDKQALSIPSQDTECNELRNKHNLPKPKVVYKESKSAKYANKREGFTEMVTLIESGEINAILCWNLNRLARNMREGGILIDLLSEGMLVIITSNGDVYDETSDMGIVASLFGASKQFSMSLSRDVKRGQRTKAAAYGYGTSSAPIGFLNSKEGEKGARWWYVDDERIWKVKKLFELFLTEHYSVGKICRYANEELKLTTPPKKKLGGRSVTLANTYKMLKNPVYAGFFIVQGKRYELNKDLPRVITEEQHKLLLEMISNNKRPKVQKHDAIYSGFILSEKSEFIGQDVKFQLVCDCKHKFAYRDKTHCPNCEKRITHIENPKYTSQSYYYNNRKKKAKLKYKSISEAKITDTLIIEVVDRITLPTPLLEWSKQYILELKDKEVSEGLKINSDRVARQAEYERKKIRTREMYRDEKITEEEYDSDMTRLDENYKDLSQVQKQVDWAAKMNELVDLSLCIRETLTEGNFQAKRSILNKLGSNFIWDDEKLTIINRKSVKALISGSQSLYSDSDTFGKEKTLVTQEFNPDMEQIHIALRRMWDSNPREVLPSGGLVNRCLQPLGQSSNIFASLKLSPFGKISLVSATELSVLVKSETVHSLPTRPILQYCSRCSHCRPAGRLVECLPRTRVCGKI